MEPSILIIIVAVLAVVFTPIAAIWAVNTLFGLTIAMTLKNIIAAFILSGFFKTTSFSSKKTS